MANTDKVLITPDTPVTRSLDQDNLVVVVNDEGQHAMWWPGLPLPALVAATVGPYAQNEPAGLRLPPAWPDIAPVSAPGRNSGRASYAARPFTSFSGASVPPA